MTGGKGRFFEVVWQETGDKAVPCSVEISKDRVNVVVRNSKLNRRRLRLGRSGMANRVSRGRKPRSSKESRRFRRNQA